MVYLLFYIQIEWRWCSLSTLDSVEDSIQELYTKRHELFQTSYDFFIEMVDAEYATPARKESEAKYDEYRVLIAEIDEELKILESARDLERNRFRRPTGWMGSLTSRWLGPLPENGKVIHPNAEQLAKVGSYRLFAGLLVVVAIGTLLTIAYFMPWMLVSPATIITMGTKALFGEAWGVTVGMVIIATLVIFASGIKQQNRYQAKFWDGAAMFEEQWFRMGAENWTIGQRLKSTLLFGLVHIVNIIYPISSLLVVGAVGGVFMMVYLRAYKKTGSTELATLTSAKLHATYNRFAIVYFIIAVGFSLAYGVYQLFA